MVPIIVLLVASQLTTEAAQPPAIPQYLVIVSIRETHNGRTTKPGKILADTNLKVVAGRENSFQTGAEISVGDQKVPYGFAAKLRIDPAQNDQVHVSGMIEVSTITEPDEGVVAREGKSIHFSKVTTCGKSFRICMSKSAGYETWCDVQIDRLDMQTAQRTDVAPKDVPRQ